MLRGLNLALMFVLEIAVYVAVAVWGWQRPGAYNMTVAFSAPVLMALVWGTFGAPKARLPLRGVARIVLEVLWFGAGLLALLEIGQLRLATAFGLLFVVNAALRVHWRQSPFRPDSD